MSITTEFLSELTRLLGRRHCLHGAAAARVYACDASHMKAGLPLAVALPQNEDQAVAVVELCARFDTPFVCRGAGTGLSGGAVPLDGAVVVSLAGLTDLDEPDVQRRLVRAGAGVINETVSESCIAAGLHFAPDPSSQAASTIGGNIAENAGGPHCLAFGVTRQHVARAEWIDTRGRTWNTGRGLSVERGIDILPLLVGSEGCLGLVTAADLRLEGNPQSVSTLLAAFPKLGDATRAVVKLLGAGILPVAMELVDRVLLRMVEEAFAFGFPTDVDAVMIVEFAGRPELASEDADRAVELLKNAGASRVNLAADEAERLRLWTCRKKAFGAVGRLAPAYITMDVVVPLGRLPGMIEAIAGIRKRFDVQIATALHAGDGNMHPGVLYDDRDPDSVFRSAAAADAIIAEAIALGGSCTGEHGVGLEKLHVAAAQLDPVSAGLMHGIRELFDPASICNTGKLLPPREGEFPSPPRIPAGMDFQLESLTVSAPAQTALAEVQALVLESGFCLPVGLPIIEGSDLRRLVDHLVWGPMVLAHATVSDLLLEVWATTGDGRPFHAGAPVFKNVAGLDLVHLLCGAGGQLAKVQAVTMQLKPAPEAAAFHSFLGTASSSRLEELFALLDRWDDTGCAPTVVVDVERIVVFIAGRRRKWDLETRQDALQRWARSAGLQPGSRATADFADLPRLLTDADLPRWCHGSDWTMLAACEAECRRPVPVRRGIRQSRPGLWWTPKIGPEAGPEKADGWYTDMVTHNGQPTEIPAPDGKVPTAVLAGLKRLFDPGLQLPVSAWLHAALEADDD